MKYLYLRMKFVIILLCLFSYVVKTFSQINVENVLIMGRRAIGVDDYVTAIYHFNQVINARPHDYKGYYYRAYVKFSLEE